MFYLQKLIAKILKPLPNFDYRKEAIYMEQGDLYLEKPINIKLYTLSDFTPITYNENAILFNYLRDFKIIKRDGQKRYFAKINVLDNEGSSLAGQCYIDLNEVAMFASIPD